MEDIDTGSGCEESDFDCSVTTTDGNETSVLVRILN